MRWTKPSIPSLLQDENTPDQMPKNWYHLLKRAFDRNPTKRQAPDSYLGDVLIGDAYPVAEPYPNRYHYWYPEVDAVSTTRGFWQTLSTTRSRRGSRPAQRDQPNCSHPPALISVTTSRAMPVAPSSKTSTPPTRWSSAIQLPEAVAATDTTPAIASTRPITDASTQRIAWREVKVKAGAPRIDNANAFDWQP